LATALAKVGQIIWNDNAGQALLGCPARLALITVRHCHAGFAETHVMGPSLLPSR
jgi:hypothetical protein